MDLSEASALARRLMNVHGLTRQGWFFEFDNAKRRFGCTHFGQKKVTLSAALTRINGREDVLDVILHEIAHVLAGPQHGHDAVWKNVACTVGARPERCYEAAAVNLPPASIEARCPHCGIVHKRHRMPKNGRRVLCKCTRGMHTRPPLVWRRVR